MDKDIRRLLKLSQIPGFKLQESEEKKLAEWKKEQFRVKVPKKQRVIPKGYAELDGIGADGKNTLIATSEDPQATKKKKTTRRSSRKKIANVVKYSDKEIGEIEEP